VGIPVLTRPLGKFQAFSEISRQFGEFFNFFLFKCDHLKFWETAQHSHVARQEYLCGPRNSPNAKSTKILIYQIGIFLNLVIAVARKAIFSSICGPLNICFCYCGPQVDLSLRPLLYTNIKVPMELILSKFVSIF
jgi:hypothetical protein